MEAEPRRRVTRIRSIARDPHSQRVRIEGTGEYTLEVKTIHALGLREGEPLDAQQIQRLEGAANRHGARRIALRLLQRRLRSQHELIATLQRRGVETGAVLAVVSELGRAGWIDDTRFARAWVRDRLALRPCGRRRLRAELQAKGVETEVADAAITALMPPDAEDDLALSGARQQLQRLRAVPRTVAARRLVGWLQRRGFSPSVVEHVIRALRAEGWRAPDADPAA